MKNTSPTCCAHRYKTLTLYLTIYDLIARIRFRLASKFCKNIKLWIGSNIINYDSKKGSSQIICYDKNLKVILLIGKTVAIKALAASQLVYVLSSTTSYSISRKETYDLYFIFEFSINLVAFYHKCRSLIGYATHYLFALDFYLNNRAFLSRRNYRLLVAPRKFDILKILRTSNFQGAFITPIVPRHSIVFIVHH